MVQGCWSWIQDPCRGGPGHLRWCVPLLLQPICAGDQTSGSDKKCPFTGEVSIRGRILTGRVVSTKMTRTIISRLDYLHYIPKYSAYCSAAYMRTHSYLRHVGST